MHRAFGEGGGDEKLLNEGNCWVNDHKCRASCEYLDEAFKIEFTQLNSWKYTFFSITLE